MAPHFASGSCARLKHVMDELAQFQQYHSPPTNEDELVAYCQELAPVLTTLETAGTGNVGAVPNLNRSAKHTNRATPEQHDQQLSQATLPARQAGTSSGR